MIALLAIVDSDASRSVGDGFAFKIRQRLARSLPPKRHRRNAPQSSDNPEALSNVASERNHGYLAAMRNYEAAPYADEIVFVEACLEADDTPFGWNRLAARLEVHQLPADHLGILGPPVVTRLADILRAKLG